MAKFKINGIFSLIDKVSVAGKIESGVITPGMKIYLEGNIFEVKSIDSHMQQVAQANPRDAAGLILSATQVQEGYKDRGFFEKLLGLGKGKDPNFGIFNKYQNMTIDVL